MKLIFLVLVAALAVLAVSSPVDAGDQLTAYHSYSMLNRDGTSAGHVSVDGSGDITYHPGDGSSPIPYDWDPVTRKYRNTTLGDWFEFYSWPSQTWQHDFDAYSSSSTGTFSENPGTIVPDPI